MVPLGMEMVDVFAQRPAQRALAEQDHLDRHSSLTDLCACRKPYPHFDGQADRIVSAG
jgi:hypothetical protein